MKTLARDLKAKCFVETFWSCVAIGFALFGMHSPVIAQGLQVDWAPTYELDPSKTNQGSKVVKVADGLIVGGSSANEQGDLDYVLVKYNASGQEQWVRRYDSGSHTADRLRDLQTDPSGNIFVTGSSDTVKYNAAGEFLWRAPFAGRALRATTNVVYVTGFSDTDFATAQLENDDVTGATRWVRTYDGEAKRNDISSVLATTTTGDVLVGGVETTIHTRSIDGVLFTLLKYQADGTLAWSGKMTNAYPDYASILSMPRSLVIDSSGSAYIMGQFDAYMRIASFLPSGAFDKYTLVGFDNATDMQLIPDGGLVVVGTGPLTSNGKNVAVIQKYLPTLTRVWQRSYIADGAMAVATAVRVATNGDIYTTGYAGRQSGDVDAFLVQYKSDGTIAGSALYDDSEHQQNVPAAVQLDDVGSVYLTGYSLTQQGGSRFMTLKYSQGARIQAQPSGAMHLGFHTTPSQQYAIEATSDFLNWQSLITNTADANGLLQFDDTNAPTPYRFYRGKQP